MNRKLLVIAMISLLAVTAVFSLPTGPTSFNQITSSRYPVGASQAIQALAGNTTEINFAADSITQTWQGYFGNVTGNLVLGDSSNNTLYDWNLASPSGEIYATRTASTPNWASIRCANATEIDAEDAALGVNQSTDMDSVNRTFLNTTSFNSFFVGSVPINTTQNCYAAYLYNDTGAQTTNFAQILLSDTSNIVYTALLSRGATGFDNRSHDFQLIVGEDGHDGDTATTPYYFYLELQ